MKTFGKATIQVNGKRLQSYPGASCDIGGVTRNSVVGDNDFAYSEANKQSSVNCEVMIPAGFSLRELSDNADISVVFKMDTGQSYLQSPAWLVNPPVATAGEGGRVALQFEGPPMQET